MCKHFNLTATYVDEDLLWTDWYCMVSVALDAEEDISYERLYVAYIAAGGDPKKFPKAPKKVTAPGVVERQGKDSQSIVVDALKRTNVQIGGRKGNVEDYARAKGLKKVFRHSDGTITDEHGVVIEQRPGFAFVRSSVASEER